MKFTIDKREEIDSTNLEVIRQAKTGAPEGTLVQAERQISGREEGEEPGNLLPVLIYT